MTAAAAAAAVCLATGPAASAATTAEAVLPAAAFTLAWDHSVERVRWEEDYRVVGDRLELTEARVRGSAAGMEPPDGAVLAGGWWRYRPDLPPLPELTLAASGFGGRYELCFAGACRPLADLLPPGRLDAAPVRVRPCLG